MRGQRVTSPDGSVVVLADVGTSRIYEDELIRIWDVTLEPGARHPWHQHHNPYVVLSVRGSSGRMDWLDGSPPREILEYTGGCVFRPVSPVHCLTNTGPTPYRNRLIELLTIGEKRAEGVLDVGTGDRSIEGEPTGPELADGRTPVLHTDFVRVWTVDLGADEARTLDLDPVPHIIAELDHELEGHELSTSVQRTEPGEVVALRGSRSGVRTYFVVALDYLQRKDQQR